MPIRKKANKASTWTKLASVTSSTAIYSTPLPSKEQVLEDRIWKLNQEVTDLQRRLSAYNDAVRSIVMRLKVLDIDKLAAEVGEDGTIPMRLMLKELLRLQQVYDDKRHDQGGVSGTASATISPSQEF